MVQDVLRDKKPLETKRPETKRPFVIFLKTCPTKNYFFQMKKSVSHGGKAAKIYDFVREYGKTRTFRR